MMMPFEGQGNGMTGQFCYVKLEERLKAVRKAIDEETQHWMNIGKKAHENQERIASNLLHQFEQCRSHFSTNPGGVTVNLEMEKDNPFGWTIVPTPLENNPI